MLAKKKRLPLMVGDSAKAMKHCFPYLVPKKVIGRGHVGESSFPSLQIIVIPAIFYVRLP